MLGNGSRMTRFQIFGERCSGTNYLEALLKHNFGDECITWDYGWKHWYVDYNFVETVDTVFIVIIRNFLDWVRSFYRQPHHLVHPHDSLTDFMLDEVESRDANGLVDVVEPNIFRLRAGKIRNFLGIVEHVQNFEYIRYEDLIREPKDWVRMISGKYGIPIIDDEIVETVSSYKGLGKRTYEPLQYDDFTNDEFDIIRYHLDRDAESLAAYTYDRFQCLGK